MRCLELIEHEVATLAGQRVFGIARMAMSISTSTTNCAIIRCWRCWRASLRRREDCAPAAGNDAEPAGAERTGAEFQNGIEVINMPAHHAA